MLYEVITLPLRALAAVGNGIGRLAYWLVPERRRVTLVNLRKCFPGMRDDERRRIAKAHFRTLCVITSYSIHYTKLYDTRAGERLLCRGLGADRHQRRHFGLGDRDFLAAPVSYNFV